MQARFKKHRLYFKRPSGTSRGVLTYKDSWFLVLHAEGKTGIGECSILEGLSPDDPQRIEAVLSSLCSALEAGNPLPDLTTWPAIQMGLETALCSLEGTHSFSLYPSKFTQGKGAIPINGLVWMGTFESMNTQIRNLLKAGYNCIKLKIGALDFERELDLLAQLRKEFTEKEVILRVDANGAFQPDEALEKLKRLSEFEVHSIEQPIGINQWQKMADLCSKTPVPIALDEELIGPHTAESKQQLLEEIKPQFIILKPSLLGGFKEADQWIQYADNLAIGWWITSALESNIGLNAIAQWTYLKEVSGHQGLGTGSLFTNNISSPLRIKKGCLMLDNSLHWEVV
ncbi:MAG: o-succinylbenzoate synthase [Flavobacteriaceae bacterium]